MLLTGTFRRAVDEKARFALPKPLRAAMEKDSVREFFVAPGIDGCLAVYPEPSFRALGEKLAGSSPAGQDVRAFSRMFYARAQAAEVDAQGRMRLPQELQQLAGIAGEVVVVGVRDHLELWQVARWEEYLRERQERFDEIAERAFGP